MSVLHQQIGAWLGIRIPKTDQQMLEIVERQLATSAINRLLALGVTRSEIDALVIPLRTLQHRRSRREKLTVEDSDRVLRLLVCCPRQNPSMDRGSERWPGFAAPILISADAPRWKC